MSGERVFTVNTGLDDYVDDDENDESDASRDGGTDEADGSGVAFEYDETDDGASSVDESSPSPFTQCEDCGTIHVTGAAHSCESDDGDDTRPTADTREGREALIALDDRAADETVLFLRGRSDSSYHEYHLRFDLDAMLAFPVTPENCPAEPRFREFERDRRGYVQDTGRPPCLYCHPEVRRRRNEGENAVGK